ELKKDTLVITVMSNLGVQIMSRENDLNLATTKVGDRYVLEEMLKSGYNLGGEQSGHVILLDHATTGDGMLTALALLKSIYRNKTTLSNASLVVAILPQVLLPAYVRDEDKETVMNDSDITSKIEAINMSLGNEGRVLVRPSGTEPMIRVMLEGKDLDNITALAKELVDLISSKYSEK
nr:phosphoglucosamine mutase [Saccharofermentans sp.]